MSEAANKIIRAKIQLIINEPFFATVALSTKFEENAQIETACTDGKTIQYNPEFIDSLSLQQCKGLIAHEVMHITSLHHTRRESREIKNWNIATDYVINDSLVKSGFELPPDGYIDKAGIYKDKSAEQIYAMLPPGNPEGSDKGKGDGKGGKGGNGGNDPGKSGGVKDAPGKTKSEVKSHEAETKQLIAQAMQAAKRAGKLPGHLQKLVESILQPKINWKEYLSAFLTEISRNDYTWKMPSKRYISQGLYLPSLQSIEKGKFVLMVDTSGSIYHKTQEFAREMQSIVADLASSITVIFVDTKVRNVQEFESEETIKLTAKGGGGTDFKPGFDYIDSNDIECACVVYFTDGECNSFPTIPDYPVLWATYENENFKPPFGEVITVSEEN